MKNYDLILYTDGACKGNGKPDAVGGYGIILERVGSTFKAEFSQGYIGTTNNRMELLGVINGLNRLKKKANVLVVSDSQYVIDSVVKKWVFNWEKNKFKDKKNSDLWIQFLEVYRKHNVDFQWIKGHNEHPQNERCDELANIACKSDNLIRDEKK